MAPKAAKPREKGDSQYYTEAFLLHVCSTQESDSMGAIPPPPPYLSAGIVEAPDKSFTTMSKSGYYYRNSSSFVLHL
jgi:hypothetical protein